MSLPVSQKEKANEPVEIVSKEELSSTTKLTELTGKVPEDDTQADTKRVATVDDNAGTTPGGESRKCPREESSSGELTDTDPAVADPNGPIKQCRKMAKLDHVFAADRMDIVVDLTIDAESNTAQ